MVLSTSKIDGQIIRVCSSPNLSNPASTPLPNTIENYFSPSSCNSSNQQTKNESWGKYYNDVIDSNFDLLSNNMTTAQAAERCHSIQSLSEMDECQCRLTFLSDAMMLLTRLISLSSKYDDDEVEIKVIERIKEKKIYQYRSPHDHLSKDNKIKMQSNSSEKADKKKNKTIKKNEMSLIQRCLEDLMLSSLLQDTSFPPLLQQVLNLKSHLQLTTQEVDATTTELHTTRRNLIKSIDRIDKLERGIKRLYDENQTLRRQLSKMTHLNKQLRVGLKQYLARMRQKEKDDDERQHAMMMVLHEHFLIPAAAAAASEDDDERLSTTSATTTLSSLSASSSSSSLSLVTDDGRATVTLTAADEAVNTSYNSDDIDFGFITVHQNNNNNGGATSRSSNATKTANGVILPMRKKRQKNVYHVTYPNRDDVGVQLTSVPLLRRRHHHRKRSLISPSNIIKNKINKNKKKNKNDNNGDDDDDDDDDDDNHMVAVTTNNHDDDKIGFIICGLYDHSTKATAIPTLGARLVAVNHISIETTDDDVHYAGNGQWTLKDLQTIIMETTTTTKDGDKRPLTLSFRNDTLNKHQSEIYKRAAAREAERVEQQLEGRKKGGGVGGGRQRRRRELTIDGLSLLSNNTAIISDVDEQQLKEGEGRMMTTNLEIVLDENYFSSCGGSSSSSSSSR